MQASILINVDGYDLTLLQAARALGVNKATLYNRYLSYGSEEAVRICRLDPEAYKEWLKNARRGFEKTRHTFGDTKPRSSWEAPLPQLTEDLEERRTIRGLVRRFGREGAREKLERRLV